MRKNGKWKMQCRIEQKPRKELTKLPQRLPTTMHSTWETIEFMAAISKPRVYSATYRTDL